MSFSAPMQAEPNMDSFIAFIKSIGRQQDEMQAKRIGISVEKLRNDTRNDLWLYGKQILGYGAADRIAPVTCDSRLVKDTYTEDVQVMVFTLRVTWSSCPLITSPLKVEMPQQAGPTVHNMFLRKFVNFRNLEGVIRN
jgi:hypothetical protein